jgi:deoxyribonuclease V
VTLGVTNRGTPVPILETGLRLPPVTTIACLDVCYADDGSARAAVVTCDRWSTGTTIERHVVPIAHTEPYEPGAFYKRELPCLLTALEAIAAVPDVVVVDAHVWLGPGRPGLGARLKEAEPRIGTVVGVAKTLFAGAPATSILRGESKTPLWVDEIGTPVDAAARVAEMHGEFRVPTLLKLVDRLCRGREAA